MKYKDIAILKEGFADHIKKMVEEGWEPRDEYSRKVIEIASENSREQLEKLLSKALDEEDMEQVNLLLDAIEADKKYQELIQDLPPIQLEELIEYAKELTEENNRTPGDTK